MFLLSVSIHEHVRLMHAGMTKQICLLALHTQCQYNICWMKLVNHNQCMVTWNEHDFLWILLQTDTAKLKYWPDKHSIFIWTPSNMFWCINAVVGKKWFCYMWSSVKIIIQTMVIWNNQNFQLIPYLPGVYFKNTA